MSYVLLKYVSSKDSRRIPQDLVYLVTITYYYYYQSRMPKDLVTFEVIAKIDC